MRARLELPSASLGFAQRDALCQGELPKPSDSREENMPPMTWLGWFHTVMGAIAILTAAYTFIKTGSSVPRICSAGHTF